MQDGTYGFLKMPFGMVNSAATPKHAMKMLLEGADQMDYYYTPTWEALVKALKDLFTQLK